MFDLKQIRCFVCVGEELHFGRAARRMHMSQPPLSRQIRLLEHELKIELFHRTSRSVKLTPAGAVFLQEARRMLALAENAAYQAQRISRGESGLLRLGFTAGSSYSFLPKLLAQLDLSLADVDVELREMVTLQQLDALRGSVIDIGLLRSFAQQENVQTVCVAREQMMLALPVGHRLGRGRAPSLIDLKDEPFITFDPLDGGYFYELIDRQFRNVGVSARYVHKVSQIHSILALVSAGQGISLVPESARALHFSGTVIRKVRMSSIHAELFLAWRTDNANPVLPQFQKLAAKYFAIAELKSS
jgi:DNA-binding transcriptional LysR family regulator